MALPRRKSCRIKNKKKPNYNPRHMNLPEGTDEELTEAYLMSREFQLKVLDYSNTEEDMPKEIREHHLRCLHFFRNGPRKGYYQSYEGYRGSMKLLQADVLNILCTKRSHEYFMEKYGISKDLVKNILSGRSKQWIDEYLLVKKIKAVLYSRYKQNWKDTHITHLKDETGKSIAFFSSKKRAYKYRDDLLRYNKRLKLDTIKLMKENGEIDRLYPIVEEIVM